MNKVVCSACKGEMVNRGKIPDGTLLKCIECGSKKILLDEKVKKDELEFGDAYRTKFDPAKTLCLVKLFKRNLGKRSNQIQLLDVGFGTGDFISEMNKLGIKASGIECDIDAVRLLKQKGYDAFIGELGGKLNLTNKFDAITLWDLLEHVSDIEKALVQLSSLTKDKGKVLIITPCANSIFDKLANIERFISLHRSHRIMSICLNRYHLQRFSITGIRKLFERFGFRIKSIKRVHLFSLKAKEYTNGIAPGIKKWTKYSSINHIFSAIAYKLISFFRVKNKIFLVAEKA
jgi:2-polyprenyl-3-methyl-5-hydroxy-6-metoxy-1,4-benzoquinol methylase